MPGVGERTAFSVLTVDSQENRIGILLQIYLLWPAPVPVPGQGDGGCERLHLILQHCAVWLLLNSSFAWYSVHFKSIALLHRLPHAGVMSLCGPVAIPVLLCRLSDFQHICASSLRLCGLFANPAISTRTPAHTEFLKTHNSLSVNSEKAAESCAV